MRLTTPEVCAASQISLPNLTPKPQASQACHAPELQASQTSRACPASQPHARGDHKAHTTSNSLAPVTLSPTKARGIWAQVEF